MSEPSAVCAVLVTAPDAETGARVARVLVEERHAACVNLLPGVRSIYRWQGQVEEAEEVLLVIKSSVACLDALAARVKALHPYELPEVLALPAEGGCPEYLAWVLGQVTAEGERGSGGAR